MEETKQRKEKLTNKKLRSKRRVRNLRYKYLYRGIKVQKIHILVKEFDKTFYKSTIG